MPTQPTESSGVAAARLDEQSTRGAPAEHRQASVLFCDLVGSTELASCLDRESLLCVLKAYYAAGAAVIARFDGYLAQPLGDGLLAYFGCPVAHEDDATRAIRASLEILEAIERINPALQRRYGVKLAVRIGIDTGLVVFAEVSAGERKEVLAFGEPPNVAARLKDLAAPGTVVVTQDTYRHVEGYFDVRELGAHYLKGTRRATPVRQVLRERLTRTRLGATGLAGLTPFVGRETEVRLLRDRWEQTKNGRGQVVLLRGEPGIGKSRLVLALKEHVASDTPKAWLTPCQAQARARSAAFYPVVDLLERIVFEFEPNDRPEQKQRKLEGWLAQYGASLSEAMPLLMKLLSLPSDERYPSRRDGPEAENLRIIETLSRLLLARASIQPLLFILEDLHWADSATLNFLTQLISDVPSSRILVVLTFRPEYRPLWPPQDHMTLVTLTSLEQAPATQIAAWIARGGTVPETLLQQVLARAGGNPLFLEELSKWVRESGVVHNAEHSGHQSPFEIPDTLRSSLTARLDRLGSANAVAQIGAVVGREFSYELLSAVSEIATPLLDQALAQLVEFEMLHQSGAPPDSRYVFKHALIQEAAYETLLKSKRQEHHRRIADVLACRFRDVVERQPEFVAHHYTEAGLHEEAFTFWRNAEQRTLRRTKEAIAHLESALDLVSVLPPSSARDKQELGLQMSLAPAYIDINGWASLEVERACSRARALAEHLGDLKSTYGSQWGLWTNYLLRGRLAEALATGQQLLRLAEASGAPMLRVMAHHAVGYSHFYRGAFTQVREHAERAAQLFTLESELEIVRLFHVSSSAALRIMLGSSLWMLGFPEQANTLVQSGIDLTHALKHRPSEAFALAASLLLHAYNLDVSNAGRTADELLRLAKHESIETWTPFARIFLGWVMVERGEAERGIEETRLGIQMWQATGNHLNQTIAMTMLGRSLWKAGRSDEALATFDAELVEAYARQELHFAPELHRIKGEILIERALTDEGEACLERARLLARQQGARMLELRAATSLGTVWERTGRAEEALQLMREAHGAFTEGFKTADLRAARALVDRFGAR